MAIKLKTVPRKGTAAKALKGKERSRNQRRKSTQLKRRIWQIYTSPFPRWFALTSLLGTLNCPAQSSQTVTLAWDPSPDSMVAGYFRYYGGASGAYTNKADVGSVTNASVSGLLESNTYYFTVTAYDSSGLESLPSSEVSYTVPAATNSTVAPTITGQPTNQTVAAGANATFQVAASGTAPLSYQWFFNGGTLAGATNTSLVLSNVQTSQAGGYSAVVANSAGSATSAVAQLTVVAAANPPVVTITNPADGRTVSAPANIELDAAVNPNGNSIAKVQFYQNSTLIGEATSAPYSLVWSNVPAGDYTLAALVLYSGTNAASPAIQVHVTGVPLPWQSLDVGSPGLPGNASVSNGVFLVNGAGNISGSSDNFRFLYQPLSGDGSITAQISAVTNSTTAGHFGVMIRETLTSGSRYAFMGISSNGKFRYQRRRSTDGSSGTTTSSISTPPNSWVRLTRSGSTFSGYESTDGTNWTLVYSGGITMAPNPYIGFAVASGTSNVLSTATFDSATIVP